MQKLRIVELGSRSIYEVMSTEEAIMIQTGKDESPTTLMLWYCRNPSISLGRNSSLGTIKLEKTADYDIIRRISNGYTLVHDPNDPSFSFIGSLSMFEARGENEDESLPLRIYNATTSYLVAALQLLDIPAEVRELRRGTSPDSGAGVGLYFYDTFVGEKKIAPTAQVRRHNAFLQHGIFLYNPDFSQMNTVLNTNIDMSQAATRVVDYSNVETHRIHDALKVAFTKDYEVTNGHLSQAETTLASELLPKFSGLGTGKSMDNCLSVHLKKRI